jgi:hypothetical protein
MKSKCGTATLIEFLIVAFIFCVTSCFLNAQTLTELKPAVSALGYFNGDWECSGKFDSSGKVIEAHQHFVPELNGAWMLFRHDDKPPFNYHALAEWGWDQGQKQFVMTVQDSVGGIRLFRSSGWSSRQFQWDGDALSSTSPPSQRFTFERLDERHFRVSYFTLKNDNWSRMDSSTCSKQ